MAVIITLEIDPDNFAWLNDLRRRHFPPERNFLDAHLTLFYYVNVASLPALRDMLQESAPRRLPLRFAGVRDLGGGVAIDVEAPELLRLRAAMATNIGSRLSRQDSQKFRPHVTIQNKVPRPHAEQLLDEMRPSFVEKSGAGTAILFWKYLAGPWQAHWRYDLPAE